MISTRDEVAVKVIGDKIMYVYDLDLPTPFRGSPISFPHGRAFAEI